MTGTLFGNELLPFVAIAYKLVGGVVVDFRDEEADVMERSAVCPFNYVAAFFIKGGSLIPVSGLGKFLYLFERGDFADIRYFKILSIEQHSPEKANFVSVVFIIKIFS